MTKTEVYIMGQKYTVKGEASEEHMQFLARYVDENIKTVLGKSPGLSPLNAAILAAFNMADELHSLKGLEEKLKKFIDEETEKLAEAVD